MTQKYYAYTTDAEIETSGSGSFPGNKVLAILVDDSIMAMYNQVARSYTGTGFSRAAATDPTGYDTLADLQVDFPTAVQNNLIIPRGLFLNVVGFGSAFMPILKGSEGVNGSDASGGDWGATIQNMISETDDNTGIAVAQGDLSLTVTGYRGEQRTFTAFA